MDALTQWELAVNLFFQGLGTWFQPFMSAITFLGSENFYIPFLTLIYWCVSPVLGARIGLILMMANSTNGMLKVVFHSPRPYWVDTRVTAFAAETSFGLPSGHANNAMSVFGIMAASLKKKWIWVIAVALILLMGISRIYLGVHFLRDVLAGWLAGSLLLLIFIYFEAPVVRWFKQQNVWQRIGVAFLSSLLIIMVGLIVRTSVSGWEMPESWFATALKAAPEKPIDPFALEGLFTATGVWFGMVAGLGIVLTGSGAHDPSGTLLNKTLRYLVGMVGILVLYLGLGEVFPRTPDLLGFGLRFLRYALVGLWAIWLAPLVFIKLRLAQQRKAV